MALSHESGSSEGDTQATMSHSSAFVSPSSLSGRDHSTRDLALSSLHAELTRRGGTTSCQKLRRHSPENGTRRSHADQRDGDANQTWRQFRPSDREDKADSSHKKTEREVRDLLPGPINVQDSPAVSNQKDGQPTLVA